MGSSWTDVGWRSVTVYLLRVVTRDLISTQSAAKLTPGDVPLGRTIHPIIFYIVHRIKVPYLRSIMLKS